MLALEAVASTIEGTLQRLFDSSPSLNLSLSDRIVVISDLHLGDGSSRDDFLSNGELLEQILRRYYLSNGFSLVLNGDIEELQRFSFEAIFRRWRVLYELFRAFASRTALRRIVGNHDEALWHYDTRLLDQPLLASLRLSFGSDTIFVFHGHQATIFFERFNDVSGFFLRHFANRLHIRNFPVHYESTKRYRTEHRVYAFSSARKIVSVIGHTHRPLFESLSKIDTLRFRIEQLCHDYPAMSPRARAAIEKVVEGYKAELTHLWEKDRRDGMRSGLYNEQLSVPCLFNSGCAIGKRGLTAIEIAEGEIALVHWFDRRRSDRYLGIDNGHPRRRTKESATDQSQAEQLDDTAYYRTVLKRDRLEYVFSRIRLLA
ncbi:MAG TPA: metallophosphoesterase [Spirochaetia bacterium]|nr:metallophosphoesterase [Spirochaetia bacterium]